MRARGFRRYAGSAPSQYGNDEFKGVTVGPHAPGSRGPRYCCRDGGHRSLSGRTRLRCTVGRIYARRRDGGRARYIWTSARRGLPPDPAGNGRCHPGTSARGSAQNAPRRLITSLAWFTTIDAALAVVLNLATHSSSERAVFAPTSILHFALVVTTMVGSRRTR